MSYCHGGLLDFMLKFCNYLQDLIIFLFCVDVVNYKNVFLTCYEVSSFYVLLDSAY